MSYICFSLVVGSFLISCAATELINPAEAQVQAQAAWRQGWQGQWSIDWEESPIAGSLVFEGWQTADSRQQRFEILEAGQPHLVGLVYLNNGSSAAYFNRLEPAVPTTTGPPSLPFSPITDALDQISRHLSDPPQSARQQPITLPSGAALEWTFTYPQNQQLTLWLDTTSNLIVRAYLEAPNTHLTLTARRLDRLTHPHPNLFQLE